MITDDCAVIENEQTPNILKRLWWKIWGAPVYSDRGLRYWREGFYMWLGKRLPAGLVFRATDQLIEFAEERGLHTYDIIEAQSYWLTEKMD